jgi:Flp pilus assembly pilin Flp
MWRTKLAGLQAHPLIVAVVALLIVATLYFLVVSTQLRPMF